MLTTNESFFLTHLACVFCAVQNFPLFERNGFHRKIPFLHILDSYLNSKYKIKIQNKNKHHHHYYYHHLGYSKV